MLALLAFASPRSGGRRNVRACRLSWLAMSAAARPILPESAAARPGRFYDAEGPYPDRDGGMHYRIKWLTPGGPLIWLDTDARTGRVLGPCRGYAAEALPPGRIAVLSLWRRCRGRSVVVSAAGVRGPWRAAGSGRSGFQALNRQIGDAHSSSSKTIRICSAC